MREIKHNIYNRGPIIFLLLLIISSCIDETFIDNDDKIKSSYISIRGIGAKVGIHPGTTPDDYVIETLRILAFDKVTENCVSNVRYNAANGDIIQHPINPDSYDFVFLANEPANTLIIDQLDGITKYEDLNDIAYPERYFSSDLIIPMIQEIKNITVLPNGQGAQVNGGAVVNVLQLGLDRLAVRLDVVLEAEDNLEATFTGIILENIPNAVPLTNNYTGEVERNVTRTFTKAADAGYFSDETPTASDRSWAKGVNRIILPANELKTVGDASKAVTLIVGMGNNYSPSTQLKTASDPTVSYSLPINTKLDFLGIIKEPLEVNIKASEWDKIGEDWEISGTRVLNVSDIEVNITDFNGARIAFWSNMPVVRVLDVVYDENGAEKVTNNIFNALSSQNYAPNDDFRIRYDAKTGLGYMDIVLDRPNTDDNVAGDKTYTLTLSASEDHAGTNALQRKIIVHVKQEGVRYVFEKNASDNLWSTPYVGAFWDDNEVGERVIKGIRWDYWWNWTVTVPDEYRDFIVISASPSFDPNIGTDNPGDAEDYPVVPNAFRFETGSSVAGKGRVYFRIGLKSKNTTGSPRYGFVNVHYEKSENNVVTSYDTKLFVRQGGDPDYLMRSGSIRGASDYGAKFSPYNLTMKAFKDTPGTTVQYQAINYSNLAGEVDFVKYPTQAGAHFQWALPIANVAKGPRGYHPTNVNMGSAPWAITGWPIERINGVNLFWNPSTGTILKNYYEICPPGYVRPTDGPEDRIAVNSYNYDQVYMSDWRMSLFADPMRGDAASNTVDSPYPTNGTYKPELYTPVPLSEVMYGFYADGFFDRRPIKEKTMVDGTTRGEGTLGYTKYRGVSLDNADAAYGGVLVYNSNTSASIFFPAAGRRWHLDGSLEYAGQTGYYWASSVAPGWTKVVSGNETGAPYGNIWTMQLNYAEPRPISTGHVFGYSIRCVKK